MTSVDDSKRSNHPDDTTRDAGDADRDRLSRNLKQLEALRRVFSSTQEEVVDPSCSEAESDVSCLALPAQWGHLKIIERIGSGGFGEVYRAYDPLLERDVALKLRRNDRHRDPDHTLYIDEARRLARVQHPNVLAIHGVGIHDDRVGLWADLIDGQTLGEVLKTQTSLPADVVLRIFEQLDAALHQVHRAGLVHGDVKADNVMLHNGQSVLMDFGAALHRGEKPKYGSPASMAPELFAGGALTPASDGYSLAALIFRLATGEVHWRGDSQATDDRGPDRAARRTLQHAIGRPAAGLITRMLQTDPQCRPDHAEVRRVLQRLEEAPMRRRRLIGLSVILISLLAGLIMSLHALQRVERERKRLEVIKNLVVESVQELSPDSSSGPASVNALYRIMAERVDDRLNDYPVAQSDLNLIIGQGMARFGDLQAGLSRAEQGLADYLAQPRQHPRDLAHYYNIIARLRRFNDDFDGAQSAIEESIRHFSRLTPAQSDEPDEGPLGVIRGRTLLANLLAERGLWQERVAAHRQILEDRVQLIGSGQPGSAVDYHNLAQSLLAVGHTDAAIDAEQQALALLDASDAVSYKALLIELGLLKGLLQAGELEQAVDALARCRKLAVEVLPETHVMHRHVTELAAWLAYRHGDPEASLMAYRELMRDWGDEKMPLLVRDRYAHVLLANRAAEEAAAQWQILLENRSDRYQVLLPYWQAALIMAQPDGEGTEPAARISQLEHAVQQIRQMGYPDLPQLRLIDQWLTRLQAASEPD